MANTTSDVIAAAVTFRVQKKVLANLRARLVFADPQYAEKGEFGPGFDTLMFVAYADLALNTTPLTEGTAPTPKALTQSTVTVDATQYGDIVDLSDVAKIKAPTDLADIAAERITRQAAESIDKVSRDSIALGGTAYYAGTGVVARSGLGANDKFNAALAMKTRAKMFANKIPMRGDGMYLLFVHPFVAYDLRNDSTNPGGWLDVHRYSEPSQIMKGEIGSYHGFRVIEVVNAPTFSSSVTVYASLALGDIKGWGAGELQSLRTYHVAPGGDHADVIAQKEEFGWKVLFGVAPLNNGYYFRVESAATSL